jgi:hypothetical protein
VRENVAMKRYITIRRTQVHLGFIAMLCVIIVVSSALATIYYTKTVDHQASIVTDGKAQCYLDEGCTQVLNSHDWGSFNTSSGNDTKTREFYVRNEGNVEINVTWRVANFTTYNQAEIQYETSSWTLYVVKVEGIETKLRPENDTSPDRLLLPPGEKAHLKFYLIAANASPPEDFSFKTFFDARDN